LVRFGGAHRCFMTGGDGLARTTATFGFEEVNELD
jgi:hypothetical protein